MNIEQKIKLAEATVKEIETILSEAQAELSALKDKQSGDAFDNIFNLDSFAFNPVIGSAVK